MTDPWNICCCSINNISSSHGLAYIYVLELIWWWSELGLGQSQSCSLSSIKEHTRSKAAYTINVWHCNHRAREERKLIQRATDSMMIPTFISHEVAKRSNGGYRFAAISVRDNSCWLRLSATWAMTPAPAPFSHSLFTWVTTHHPSKHTK